MQEFEMLVESWLWQVLPTSHLQVSKTVKYNQRNFEFDRMIHSDLSALPQLGIWKSRDGRLEVFYEKSLTEAWPLAWE